MLADDESLRAIAPLFVPSNHVVYANGTALRTRNDVLGPRAG